MIETTHKPPRRALLAGLSAALASSAFAAAASALPAENQDAELIGLCGQFVDLENRIDAVFETGATPIDDDRERAAFTAPLHAAQDRLVDQIYAIKATTIAGAIARGRAAIAWAPELADDGTGDIHEVILTAMLRDMMDLQS